MDHIAIMKKSWGLTRKILTGEKTIESRWHKSKRAPWDKIAKGDTIYFKDSGEPVTVKAKITKVKQYELTPTLTKEILDKYKSDLGAKEIMPEIRKYVTGKKYCILIFFDNVEKIKPFHIDKSGFGVMSAWITIEEIEKIFI